MNWKRKDRGINFLTGVRRWIFIMITFSILPGLLAAQKPIDPISPNNNKSPQDTTVQEVLNLHRQVAARQSIQDQQKIIPGLIPTFFERESPKGSPYLTPNWMIGLIETTYQKTIPAKNEVMYFNYNKMKGQIIAINKDNEILSIPNESVFRFTLVDSNRIYEFEKVPGIGEFYLMPVSKTEKGYSLYRRVITRMVPANFRSEGYYTTGEKHDEYQDFFEYYLVYPDQSTYKKFFLKESAIRSAFKDFPEQFNDFTFSKNSAATEKSLVSMIESINASSRKRAG